MAAGPSQDGFSPARFGLAAKLFAVLLLLGASGVLVTSVLGYLRASEALRSSIFSQLTVTRETKAYQIENYFHSIRREMRVLARTRMVIEALRGFRDAVDELDSTPVPPEVRKRVLDWYDERYMPTVRRLAGPKATVQEFLPVGSAAYFLQDWYIVSNPYPPDRRKLLDAVPGGGAYDRIHEKFHPLMRTAAVTLGFADFMIVDRRTSRIVYSVDKEPDFASSLLSGPYRRSNLAAAAARCAQSPDTSATCLEDFADYLPASGQPMAFMAAPIIEHGAVVGVLVAELSIHEIDNIVTSRRRWRHEGLGATGEAYLVGPDYFVRSSPRLFFEDRDRYLALLQGGQTSESDIADIRRHGTPILNQRVETAASRAAVGGVEGTGEVTGYLGTETLASWGPVHVSGVTWGLVTAVDVAEAFAPLRELQRELAIVGAFALLAMVVTAAWLSRSLLGPLRELTSGVRRFAAGDFETKVAVRTGDEIGQLCSAFNTMVGELRDKNAIIETKNRENEELLLNVLPGPIANRLRGGEMSIADGFAEVTVAFADIVGFTEMSAGMPPARVVTLLNGLFSRFDEAAQELGIEKIKTVGDAYMAVCGLPVPAADHAARMVRMAIRMVHITREHALENKVSLKLRVGINSGPVVAGVIGKSKYIYDLWGDTVNLASRMESGGLPDMIQVTRPVYERLKDEFAFEPRGPIEVKGKGHVEAWLLKL